VFNHYLGKRIEKYNEDKSAMNYNTCSADMTSLKNEREWLKEVDSTALQSSLKDLETAYQNFFRRVKQGENPGFPRFKSKRSGHKSYKAKCVGTNIKVHEKHVQLPKLGLVQCAVSKSVEGRILNATVSQNPSGKYFVSICCTDVDIPQYESTGATVGIDLGISSLAITSDGEVFENPKHIKQSEKKLAKLQRQLSRKTKGSNNRNKARVKVAILQEHIANRRKDAINKMTTQLVKGYDVICIEDLAVRNMVKNRRLSKAISDASWGEIRRQLTYKTALQHKMLIVVGRYFPSSQLCNCGYKNADVKSLNIREWRCPKCNTYHDRDKNAADNILTEGLRIIA
jgi:putative transposase